MKFLKTLFLAALAGIAAFVLQGCGYSAAPMNKSGVGKLFIPVFKSNVMEPNLGSLVTDTVVKDFQIDGTMQIADKEDADATLKGTITQFQLSPARFRLENERSVREYYLSMGVEYEVTKKGEKKPYASGTVVATTSFFTGDDLVNDKRVGVSYVAEKIAKELASRLTESW